MKIWRRRPIDSASQQQPFFFLELFFDFLLLAFKAMAPVVPTAPAESPVVPVATDPAAPAPGYAIIDDACGRG
jgi:hypothetical protein